MPAIKITATKGLPQVSGTTTIPSGTLSGHKKVAVSSTAAKTLVAADSGKVIFIDGSSGHAYTLPTSNMKGLHYKFIMTDTTADCTITAGSAIIKGEAAADGGTGVSLAGTTITMELAGAIGDWVELVSDGTNWYASGYTANSAGVSAA